MLHLFPTSRMVREFYSSFSENSLLPRAESLANFEAKILLIPNLILASEDTRVLTMQEACRFENFKKLHIPDEFLAFLSNSSYLFRFFQELAVEQKSCEDLAHADVYAEFGEHLDILEELLKRYTNLLTKKGLYDSITLPNLYEINEDYLKRYDKISLHVEGFLNNFEWKLFLQISKITNIEIILFLNRYNQKMRELFLSEDIQIPKEGKICVNLQDKSFEILEQKENNPLIFIKSFSQRSLQIGYIKEQISNFISEGMEPEEIVVILPDESFAPLVKAYDKLNNLNFAMGFSFTKTKIFQTLNSIPQAIKEDTPLTKNSLQRYNVGEKIIQFQNLWATQVEFEDFKKLLDGLELEFSTQTKAVFENELYHISVILKQVKLKLSQIFKLFLQRLSKTTLDDTKGGRVVVMGLLETRGVKFKGVIIPDFNDEFIPRFSQKDMFLSSKLREHAKLPSLKDRENLQRYYYHQIIQNAKKVAISYVQNDTSMVSRFLQSLKVQEDNRFSQNSYATLLFEKKEQKEPFFCEDLVERNSLFDEPISSSRLKLFLTCKRGYYFSYIQNLKDEDLPSDDLGANDVGNFLHESLRDVYKRADSFQSVNTLHQALCESLNQKHHKKALWLLEREIWQKRLFSFCQNEIRRFDEGWRPFEFEKKIFTQFEGLKIYGIIDRIDRHESGEFCVLDYKSGRIYEEKNIDKITDFQLQFYHILAQSRYKNIKNAGFYDLVNSRILWDENMDEKIKRLADILRELKNEKEINFTIDEKDCRYSPYGILLGRL